MYISVLFLIMLIFPTFLNGYFKSNSIRLNRLSKMFSTSTIHPLQSIYNNWKDGQSLTLSENQIISSPEFSSTLELINNLTIKDLDLTPHYLNTLQQAECLTILEHPAIEISAFLLPKDMALPLHDHPNMIVCSKILFGKARIKSYSLGDTQFEENSDITKIQTNFDKIKSGECTSWYLTPTKGNFHEIIPLTTTVLFDVFLPPYNDIDRNCSFYRLIQDNSDSNSIIKLNARECEMVDLPWRVPYIGYKPF